MKEKVINPKLNKKDIFLNGIINENPIFRLVLGMCPTLAVTTAAINGLAMGLAVTFVLVCSNALISLLRKLIPDKVRIPAFITIVATFVTIVDMVMAKFIPSLYESLGLFIPLIVVNCVILARAESFACKNSVGLSIIDGFGMGFGFMISLTLLGIVREFIGAGSFFGLKIPVLSDNAMTIFILPAGGFLTLGMLMAAVNAITAKIKNKKAVKIEAADNGSQIVVEEAEK